MITGRLQSEAFFAPLSLLAVALLAVNDHLLKARFGNWLTGKLSDVAVCFFLPLFLAALLALLQPAGPRARLVIGCVIAAAAFTALEVWPPAIEFFCRVMPFLSGSLGAGHRCQLTRDISDLACLALVPAAYVYGVHHWRSRSAPQELS